MELNRYSKTVTQDESQPASQAMLYGIGLTEEDMKKPQVGIASTWYEGNTCNMHLNGLSTFVKDGVRKNGMVGLQFNTIGISDGITNGTDGMRYSLVSREIIADSVETVMNAERFDGMVTFAGCDKSLPGMMMAAARLDVASVFVYAGSTLPGQVDGKDVTIIDAFEAVGACARGLITKERVDQIERAICPGEGACGGMYTANTMAAIGEAIGLSLPGSAAPPAVDRRRDAYAIKSGEAVVNLIKLGITTRDILTKKAFENAITILMALGGSTNAVLHLLAIAYEAEVDLTLEDFHRIGSKVPLLGDLKPFGKYVMTDVDRVGGIPVVLRILLDAGYLHGDCMTVTGKTMAENLADINPPFPDSDVLFPADKPISTDVGITILGGTLATDGAVCKTAGIGIDTFEGPARVFEREQAAMDAVENGTIKEGDVVVIRYEGPKGGPGMREMLMVTGAIKGAGLGKKTLLLTDGRFSGGSTGLCVGHISPEAVDGGPIAFIKDGDRIRIDIVNRTLDLLVDPAELEARKVGWKPIPHKFTRGVLAKFSKGVSSASEGAVWK
jgi:dihydroxy-acid dehydratase